jgi:hypothetical protein
VAIEISFTIWGDELFAREIERVGKRGSDMRPVLKAIGEKWLDWNWEQFISEGKRASGGWAPLTPETHLYKELQGLNPMILQAHERLIEAMTEPKSYWATEDFLIWQLEDDVNDYAKYHQTGTSKMPQRKPLEWTEQDKTVMMKMLQTYLTTGRTDFLLFDFT